MRDKTKHEFTRVKKDPLPKNRLAFPFHSGEGDATPAGPDSSLHIMTDLQKPDEKVPPSEMKPGKEYSNELNAGFKTTFAKDISVLKQSELFLQGAMNALEDNIAILDKTGTIIFVNKSWRSFGDSNGMTLSDYGIGRNYLKICDQSIGPGSVEAAAVAQNIRNIIEHRQDTFIIEYPCHSPDTERWFEMSVTRFEIEGSSYIVIKHKDITQHKLLDQYLLDETRINRILLDSFPNFAMILESETREIVAANDAALKMGAKIGKTCFESTSQKRKPCSWCMAPNVWKTGKAMHAITEWSGKFWDAHWIPLSENLYLHYAFDITKIKLNEAALAESEEKYRMQLEEALDAIFLADAETGLILDCNPAAEKLTGRNRSELIGMHQKSLHPTAEHSLEFSDSFTRHIQDDEGKNLDDQVITKSGELIPVSIKANIFEFKGRKLIQGIFRDITDSKKAEALMIKSETDLKHKKDALEQKNIAIKEMIEQINIEKNKIKEDIALHIENTLMPIVSKMRLVENTAQYKDLLLYHLNTMASSFGHKVSQKSGKLTSRELEICNMIKAGLTSKEICRLLNTSDLTVSKHRRNIRNKLGLSNKKVNLWSFLNKL